MNVDLTNVSQDDWQMYIPVITHYLPKKQMIILSVCHAGVVTHQVQRTTSSRKGLGFLNVIKLKTKQN